MTSTACSGDQRDGGSHVEVRGIAGLPMLPCRDVAMAGEAGDSDIVHCHTWYTYLVGCLVKQFMDIPLIITGHSLEPLRPWKREQIGAGYHVSSWIENIAVENADGVIAVSQAIPPKEFHSAQGGL